MSDKNVIFMDFFAVKFAEVTSIQESAYMKTSLQIQCKVFNVSVDNTYLFLFERDSIFVYDSMHDDCWKTSLTHNHIH